MQKIPLIIADFEAQISSTISIGATTFSISSNQDDDGVTLPDGLYVITADYSSNKKEYLLGTKTGTAFSNVKSVSRQGGLVTGAVREHRVGSPCKITDFSSLQVVADTLRGVVSLDGSSPLSYDAVPTLTNGAQLATVQYVLDVVSGGSASFDNLIFTNQTAGETIAQGNAVYLKFSDMRWYKAEADVDATISNTLKGIAKGAGSTGNVIAGGVQIFGMCNVFTGLTANTDYWLADTAGAISTTPGTKKVYIGKSSSTTNILVNINMAVGNPTEFVTTSAGAGDVGKGVVLNASGKLDPSLVSTENPSYFGDGSDGNVVLDGTNTYSFLTKVGNDYTMQRDTYFNNVTVSAGCSLISDGWLISINGTLDGSGTINWGVPSNGANGTATGGAGGASSGSGRFKTTAGGAGATNGPGTSGSAGQLGGNGGRGGNDVDSIGQGGAAVVVGSQYVKIGSMAYNTLNGFDLASGATFNFKAYLGGSGGSGGGSNSGGTRAGGGGAGGAVLIILVRNWTGTVVLKSIGGNGGNGGNGGGGASGAGGAIVVVYLTKTWTGSYNVAAGTNGTGGTGGLTSGAVGVSREYQIAALTR
jgi:hypothetical protein